MKRIAILSLLLNILLLGMWVQLKRQVNDLRQVSPAPTAAKPARPLARPARAAEPAKGQAFNWSSVESADYRAYIANLRSVGCPEETVRDIIRADVAKLYEQKRRALLPKSSGKFWQGNALAAENRLTEQQLRALAREEEHILADLLGPGVVTATAAASDTELPEQSMFSHLPPEKRDKMRAWHEKYFDQEVEIYTKSVGGMLSAEDEKALQELNRQKKQELAQILTPSELEDYELRNSPLADSMRESLVGGVELTEAEFRNVYRLQKAFSEKYEEGGSEVDPKALAMAKTELEKQLQQTLGEKKFSEFKRGSDPDYRDLLQLSERYQLNPETANQIYQLRQAASAEREKLLGDPALDPVRREAALQDIQARTRQTIQATLGNQAFEHYQRRFEENPSE